MVEKSGDYIPDSGDFLWLAFSPQAGREQAGRRPALCLSPRIYNEKTGLGLFCPVTSRQKGYPFEVSLPEGLPIEGVVLADHVRSLDWRAREASFIARGPQEVLEGVLERVGLLLGF